MVPSKSALNFQDQFYKQFSVHWQMAHALLYTDASMQ